ncbi:helix-turn-helix transcriptional regulator [Fibrobacter sp.]|uniref:helix-turn-helix transcriptional regulator n=1 Tax=Fibrobacter sp. TaxID=35828 RepID=UPI00389012D1
MDLLKFLSRKDMTQADLAKALETSPGNVNRWAKNEGVPSYELCSKLLELGMTTEELFGIEQVYTNSGNVSSVKEFVEVFQKSMNAALDGIKKEL